MQRVQSHDGTMIAYERIGTGPTLILVGGAFEQRALDSETAQLAASPLLAQHFTLVHYDRRGRGESGDTQPFALQREIEDIEALIDQFTGPIYLFGISSGAALAFEAAVQLQAKLTKLALYEAPYNDDPQARQAWRNYRADLDELLLAGRRGDAVIRFMMLVGMPIEYAPEVRAMPSWPLFEAVAPTLAYDAAALGEEAAVPSARAAQLALPTLVMSGEASFEFMQSSAQALAAAMPNAQHLVLAGQTHEVEAAALAPVLKDFLLADLPA